MLARRWGLYTKVMLNWKINMQDWGVSYNIKDYQHEYIFLLLKMIFLSLLYFIKLFFHEHYFFNIHGWCICCYIHGKMLLKWNIMNFLKTSTSIYFVPQPSSSTVSVMVEKDSGILIHWSSIVSALIINISVPSLGKIGQWISYNPPCDVNRERGKKEILFALIIHSWFLYQTYNLIKIFKKLKSDVSTITNVEYPRSRETQLLAYRAMEVHWLTLSQSHSVWTTS